MPIPSLSPPGCLVGTRQEAPGQVVLCLCRSKGAAFIDCKSTPIVYFLLLRGEGPRDGDLSSKAINGQSCPCAAPAPGQRSCSGNKGRAPCHFVLGDNMPCVGAISFGLESHQAFVDIPGTDLAPEGKKIKKDVCLSTVLTHFSGLKRESSSIVLSCTDTRA